MSDWSAGYNDGWSGNSFCAGVSQEYLAGYAAGSAERRRSAQAGEAGTAETTKIGSAHEHAVPKGCAQ